MLLTAMYLVFFLSTIAHSMEDPKKSGSQQLQKMSSTGQSESMPYELKPAVRAFKKRLSDKHHGLNVETLVHMSGFMGVLRNIACTRSIPILIKKIEELSMNLVRDAETAQILDPEILECYRKSEITIDKAATLLLSAKISPHLSKEGASGDLSAIINDTVVEQSLQLYRKSKAIDLHYPTQILIEQISDIFERHFTQIVQHFNFTEGQLENKSSVFKIIAEGFNKKVSQNGQEAVGALINGTFGKHLESIINIWSWPVDKLSLIDSEWQEDFSKGIPIILFFDLSGELNKALLTTEPIKIDSAIQKFITLTDAINKAQQDYNELNGVFARLINHGMEKNSIIDRAYYQNIVERTRLINCLFQSVAKKVELESPLLEVTEKKSPKIKRKEKKKKNIRRGRAKQSGVQYWERKEPAEPKKEKKPARATQKAPSRPPAIQRPKQLAEAEILKKYRFDDRIFVKKDPYHGHSLLLHPLLEEYGKKCIRLNSTNPSQKDRHYSLPGMILYMNSEPKYCFFHMCKDPKGTCYHRGYDIVHKEHFSKEGQDIEYAYAALSELEEADKSPAYNSVILKDDHAKMVIHDAQYNCLLVIFKHSFS